MEKTCCFTGHRALGYDFEEERAYKTLKKLREKHGVTTFICGGAIGFDMIMGELVLRLKEEYEDVRLYLILPCRDQDARWSLADKKRYKALLKRADEIEYIQDYYSEGVMRARNYKMVDKSAFCICYFRGIQRSGTAQTVRYAKRLGRQIGNLAEEGQEVVNLL